MFTGLRLTQPASRTGRSSSLLRKRRVTVTLSLPRLSPSRKVSTVTVAGAEDAAGSSGA